MTLELISQLETELAVERAEKAVLQASDAHLPRQMEQGGWFP